MIGAFKKRFSTKKSAGSLQGEVPTVPLTTKPDLTEARESLEIIRLEHPQFEIAFGQSVGQQREHNEDSLLTLQANLATNGEVIPIGLYIVADGMGGHQQGEVASGLAVRVIAEQIINRILLAWLSPEPVSPEESIQEIMEKALQDAHHKVMETAPGSGTTLTAILNFGEKLTIGHVGDSRAYAITPEGNMQPLTRDHSLVMRMMELGQLTEAEAAIHPQRNVLYRALGQGDSFAPDITTTPLPESGFLLMCSDGLWGVVPGEEISKIVTTTPNLQLACQQMVDAANAAGGPDNITAILVKLPG